MAESTCRQANSEPLDARSPAEESSIAIPFGSAAEQLCLHLDIIWFAVVLIVEFGDYMVVRGPRLGSTVNLVYKRDSESRHLEVVPKMH